MAMRYHLFGNSSPKAPERPFILPVALRYWRIGGIRSKYHCEPSLFHITHMSQLQQSHNVNEFIIGPLLVAFETVKPSNK